MIDFHCHITITDNDDGAASDPLGAAVQIVTPISDPGRAFWMDSMDIIAESVRAPALLRR